MLTQNHDLDPQSNNSNPFEDFVNNEMPLDLASFLETEPYEDTIKSIREILQEPPSEESIRTECQEVASCVRKTFWALSRSNVNISLETKRDETTKTYKFNCEDDREFTGIRSTVIKNNRIIREEIVLQKNLASGTSYTTRVVYKYDKSGKPVSFMISYRKMTDCKDTNSQVKVSGFGSDAIVHGDKVTLYAVCPRDINENERYYELSDCLNFCNIVILKRS